MRLVKQLVAVAAVAFAGNALVGAVSGNAFFTLVFGLGTAVLAVYVYGRVVRWTEKREPAEVALEGARGALGRGLLIGVAIGAGGMLAAAYAATRTLWPPIGLHFGWNFAAGILSTEVSGNGASEGLLQGVTSGAALLTGGGFGPEGSPYAVVFGLLLTGVFLYVARQRGNLVPRRRRTDATLVRTP
ncbi:CPBP family intramembrane glutamic endopeptidase [Nonomuraea sp. NPDC049504]|uniref:CPBP family intramembrane glutamic endopeptidase n=1 Tax=Nonomuraea sp. NPDC049504 TaxID=3154729 RepID=UPI003448B05E